MNSFILQDDMVAVPVRELDDLVFKGRAVSGGLPLDMAPVKSGMLQVFLTMSWVVRLVSPMKLGSIGVVMVFVLKENGAGSMSDG
jgi:hypothetical protein